MTLRSGHIQRLWPAYIVVLGSFLLIGAQYILFGYQISEVLIDQPTQVVFEEGLLSIYLLFGIGVIQRLRDEPRVYPPLMAGMTIYYLYAFIDVSDEFFPPARWFVTAENIAAVVGPFFLILGIYRWSQSRSEQLEELEQRTNRLERQNERLDRFAAIVSHDLRNPLNVIQGRLELLRDDVDSRHLDSIKRASDRMGEMITDLLTLAKSGVVIDEAEQVDLETFAEQSWSNVETVDASLTVVSTTTIFADPTQFKQLLENLFRNAVTHGGSGATVRVGRFDGGFYVEDTGEGIPEEDQNRIFDGEYSTSGVGLGLSIVREIADAHGWSIDVTSSAEGGARFEFTGVEEPP